MSSSPELADGGATEESSSLEEGVSLAVLGAGVWGGGVAVLGAGVWPEGVAVLGAGVWRGGVPVLGTGVWRGGVAETDTVDRGGAATWVGSSGEDLALGVCRPAEDFSPAVDWMEVGVAINGLPVMGVALGGVACGVCSASGVVVCWSWCLPARSGEEVPATSEDEEAAEVGTVQENSR